MFEDALNKAADEGGKLNLLEKEDKKGNEERGSEHGAEAHHYSMKKRVPEKMLPITHDLEWLKLFDALDSSSELLHSFRESCFVFCEFDF